MPTVPYNVSDSDALPWYVSMYWFLYNVTVSIAVLISLLYWVLLFDPGTSSLYEETIYKTCITFPWR